MLGLYAYFTDFSFDDDHWSSVRMMSKCRKCRVCMDECPTGAISVHRFVVDVERCIPLYNEIPGEIPEWVPKDAPDSIMGCMRCQMKCPANREAIAAALDLGELSERETIAILDNIPNEEAKRALCVKLRLSTPDSFADDLPVFSRNLQAVLRAQSGID